MFLGEFTRQYLSNPRMVGAVLPSSKHLAQRMVEPINFSASRTIIEYGPGTGIFTSEIIKYREGYTKLLLFEINPVFADIIDHE